MSQSRCVGPKNGKWRGGVSVNEKGYRRLWAGPHRGEYEHRRVMEELLERPICAPYVFPVTGQIPPHMTVEHGDHVKTHNCTGNLMLLQKCIHDRLSLDTKKYYREHWTERVVVDDEVPF